MAIIFVFFFAAVVAHPLGGSEHLTVPGEPLVVLFFAAAALQPPILLQKLLFVSFVNSRVVNRGEATTAALSVDYDFALGALVE